MRYCEVMFTRRGDEGDRAAFLKHNQRLQNRTEAALVEKAPFDT